ncbi:hypothetical protein EUTSA_v10003347mg, partial [Eutrema salsugineum]
QKQIKVEHSKSTSSSFPIDLTSEILLRLPEKSVARFRCVFKLWSSITTDQYFINSFETQTRSPPLSLLLCFQKDDSLFVSTIPQHTLISNRSCSSSQPIDRYHSKIPGNYSHYHSMESVNGLICFEESGETGHLIVWNPSKKQFLTIPKPRKIWRERIVVLGYDPIDGKHKVVCIPFCNYFSDVCEVLTLGSAQESWRTVRTTYNHSAYRLSSVKCIKRIIYYLAYSDRRHGFVLMSFDVRSEKLDLRVLTSDIHYGTRLINYGGEDVEKDKWSSQDFHVPFRHHDLSLRTYFSLKGITHAGEFIYVPDTFHISFYILFFDPVRNSRRRLEFNRLLDDESGLDNGDQDKPYLHVFPNHIESQMSL